MENQLAEMAIKNVAQATKIATTTDSRAVFEAANPLDMRDQHVYPVLRPNQDGDLEVVFEIDAVLAAYANY
jgi:hypothetical protein